MKAELGELNEFNYRFYNTTPDKATIEFCTQIGASHRFSGWNVKIDPRWNDKQKQAYMDAYSQN